MGSIALTVLLSSLPFVAACQTERGHEKADSTAATMGDLRTAVADLKQKVSATAETLAVIVEKGSEDPKPGFERFTKNMKSLEDSVDKAEGMLKSMQSQGQAYFAAWEKNSAAITNADLKKVSNERRASLAASLDTISKAMDSSRAEYKPLMSSIKDAHTYLSSDLTPAGIKSIKDVAKSIGKSASTVNKHLDDVVEAINESAPQFETAKPPPPAAEPKK